jgi:molybdopterin molybdotransferase
LERLLSVSEALQKLLNGFKPVDVERVALAQACGRVLAQEVAAGYDLPPFANSSMDGFAVRTVDLTNASPETPVVLEVIEDVPAGKMPVKTLGPGQATRIMTGAQLSPNGQAVIPVEDTDFNYRDPGTQAPAEVRVFRPVSSGENVRPAGQDVRAGEIVLSSHRRLRPQDIGLLAMLGIGEVVVFRRPRIGLLSTGDELLPVDAPLEPGKIYDSNSYTLFALVRRFGCDPVPLGIANDEAMAVERLLDQAISQKVDLILSTAGVSVGAFDFVKSVVEKRGRLGFWRVNMRPGKPLAFGHYREIPFIGLPGNPVSTFVGFEVFVRPALAKLSGIEGSERPVLRLTLAEPVESDGRESYLRAYANYTETGWTARLTGHQGSGNLRSLVDANALLILPSGVKSLPIGAEVEAWLMDEPLPGC